MIERPACCSVTQQEANASVHSKEGAFPCLLGRRVLIMGTLLPSEIRNAELCAFNHNLIRAWKYSGERLLSRDLSLKRNGSRLKAEHGWIFCSISSVEPGNLRVKAQNHRFPPCCQYYEGTDHQ